MGRIVVNEERCRGCELCIRACPQDMLQLAPILNRDGYHPAQSVNDDRCTGCAMCALMCPHVAITKVYR